MLIEDKLELFQLQDNVVRNTCNTLHHIWIFKNLAWQYAFLENFYCWNKKFKVLKYKIMQIKIEG